MHFNITLHKLCVYMNYIHLAQLISWILVSKLGKIKCTNQSILCTKFSAQNCILPFKWYKIGPNCYVLIHLKTLETFLSFWFLIWFLAQTWFKCNYLVVWPVSMSTYTTRYLQTIRQSLPIIRHLIMIELIRSLVSLQVLTFKKWRFTEVKFQSRSSIVGIG